MASIPINCKTFLRHGKKMLTSSSYIVNEIDYNNKTEDNTKMNLKKAAEAQQRLSSRLNLKWEGRMVNLMAGADFGYGYKEKKIGASIVVFKIPEPLRESHRRASKIF
jgi:hypothetical protein